jgi:hypothetical protein
MLINAYDRYIELQGNEAIRAEKLWVPGLEPTHIESPLGHERIPRLPATTVPKNWEGSEMYSKDGLAVGRKGRFECRYMDTNRWDRMIWSAEAVEWTRTVPVRESVEESDEKQRESVEASDEEQTYGFEASDEELRDSVEVPHRTQTWNEILFNTEQWSDNYSIMDAGEIQSPRTEYSTPSRSLKVESNVAGPDSSRVPSSIPPLFKPKSSARLRRRSQEARKETS